MIRLAAAAFALLVAGAQDSPAPPPEPAPGLPYAVAQVTVRQQIIIRVPRGQNRVPAANAPTRWREAGGMRCVPARQIAGALPGHGSVDLVMRDNRRVRARLGQQCMGLDYYRGLYVSANSDGQICAGRDVIRSRMGGRCDIVEFHALRPAR